MPSTLHTCLSVLSEKPQHLIATFSLRDLLDTNGGAIVAIETKEVEKKEKKT